MIINGQWRIDRRIHSFENAMAHSWITRTLTSHDDDERCMYVDMTCGSDKIPTGSS